MTRSQNYLRLKTMALENGLFWIMLTLFSMGAITVFHYQNSISIKTAAPHSDITASKSALNGKRDILTLYDPDTGIPRTVILLETAGVPSEPGGS